MMMRKRSFAILVIVVVALLLTALTASFKSQKNALASHSNKGTLTDDEWAGAQTTDNLINIYEPNKTLAELGWQNVHSQIKQYPVSYADTNTLKDHPEYGWGIQAQNSSDDIGTKSYANGVYYVITLSDADKVKANKGDLTISAASINYREKIALCYHYISLKLYFDDASGVQISSIEKEEKIDTSAYWLKIENESVPV